MELHHHGAASRQMPLERVDVFETLLPDPAVRLPSSDFIPGRPMTWMRRRSSLGVASLRCQAFARGSLWQSDPPISSGEDAHDSFERPARKDRSALPCEPEAKKARALLDRMAAELSLLQRIKGVQRRNEADGSTVRLKFGSLLSDRKLVEKHRLRVRARWYALPKFPYIASHGLAIVSAG